MSGRGLLEALLGVAYEDASDQDRDRREGAGGRDAGSGADSPTTGTTPDATPSDAPTSGPRPAAAPAVMPGAMLPPGSHALTTADLPAAPAAPVARVGMLGGPIGQPAASAPPATAPPVSAVPVIPPPGAVASPRPAGASVGDDLLFAPRPHGTHASPAPDAASTEAGEIPPGHVVGRFPPPAAAPAADATVREPVSPDVASTAGPRDADDVTEAGESSPRAGSVPRTRVGMLGGLLGLLEEDAGLDVQDPNVHVPSPAGDTLASTPVVPVVPSGVHAGVAQGDLDHADDAPDSVVEPGSSAMLAGGAPALAPPGLTPPSAGPGGSAGTMPAPPSVGVLPPPPTALGGVGVPPPPVLAAAIPPPPVGTVAVRRRDLEDIATNLQSFDVGRRRRALRDLLDGSLDEHVLGVVATSLQDPEVDVRLLAIQVLERAPAQVPVSALDAVAFDADPAVRASAVGLAGRMVNPAVVETLGRQLVDESDAGVLASGLDAFSSTARAVDLDDEAVDGICTTVGVLAERHHESLRRPLRTLARTLHNGDLVHRLGLPDAAVRAGAAVLAFESGQDVAHRALARLVADDHSVVRGFANAAVARLRGVEESPPVRPTPEPDAGHVRRSRDEADPVIEAVIPGLVDALDDPKQAIRDQSRRALASMPRTQVVDWTWTRSRSADRDELHRLLTAALELDLGEVAEPLGRAVLRVTEERLDQRVIESARAFLPFREVAAQWRVSGDVSQRCDGVRLAALVEAPSTEAIRDGLADPSAHVRSTAAQVAAVLEVGGELAEVLLALVTTDGSRRVRIAAIDALRQAVEDDRVEAARRALASADGDVRLAGLELLPPEGDAAFEILSSSIRDEDVRVARRAAAMFVEHRAPEALALLWGQVRGSRGVTRDLVLDALRDADVSSLRRLAIQAAEHVDPLERVAGIAGLAALGSAERHRLLQGLEDPDARVRIEVLEALSDQRDPAAASAALDALDDPDPHVRATAVRVLVDLDDDALGRLVAAMDDPAEVVRSAAIEALRTSRSPGLVELLVEELARPAHRMAAADLLAGRQDAIDQVFEVVASLSEGDERRLALTDALRRSGEVARLVHRLDSREGQVRREALDRLGLVGGPGEVDAVSERLRDPDANVRVAAIELLGTLGGERAVDALRGAFGNDPDMDVVAAAERAYRRLSGAG